MIPLDDAALRELARRDCFKAGGGYTVSAPDVIERGDKYITLRDAARAEASPYNRLCDCRSGLMVRACNLCVERAMATVRAEQRERGAKMIPTNWCDPLLSGPTAVLQGLGPWGCPDIERLLRAIAAAIRAQGGEQ